MPLFANQVQFCKDFFSITMYNRSDPIYSTPEPYLFSFIRQTSETIADLKQTVTQTMTKGVGTMQNIQKPNQINAIQSGALWMDDTHRHIQAHGGGILYNKADHTYYWYGEHKGEDNIPSWGYEGVPATGVSCYSSKDLYNWKNEGVALPVFNNPKYAEADSTGSDDTPLYVAESSEEYQNSPLPDYTPLTDYATKSPAATLEKYNSPERIQELNALYAGKTFEEKKALYKEFNWNRVVERPKVVYNEKTKKYVMWFHSDGPRVGEYTVAAGGVAISDSPAGPFTYLGCMRMPETGYYTQNPGMLRDMTLFVDDDHSAYLIFASEENATTVIQKLNDDYTAPSGNVEGKDFIRIFTAESDYHYREAPAIFKEEGNYYMITSGQSGWAPNRANYAVSTNGILGDWVNKGDPCVGDNSETSTTFQSQSTFVLPYRDNDGNPVKGKFIYMGDRWISNNLKDSRYIWLPIELDQDTQTIRIRWSDSWKIEDYIPHANGK